VPKCATGRIKPDLTVENEINYHNKEKMALKVTYKICAEESSWKSRPFISYQQFELLG
jgi:hypothetical protein